MTPSDFLTVRELADRWHVSVRTVWRVIDAGRVSVVYPSPHTPRIPLADVLAVELTEPDGPEV